MSVLVVIVAANSLLFIMFEHAGIYDPLVPEYSGAGIAFSLLFLNWVLNRYLSKFLALQVSSYFAVAVGAVCTGWGRKSLVSRTVTEITLITYGAVGESRYSYI